MLILPLATYVIIKKQLIAKHYYIKKYFVLIRGLLMAGYLEVGDFL